MQPNCQKMKKSIQLGYSLFHFVECVTLVSSLQVYTKTLGMLPAFVAPPIETPWSSSQCTPVKCLVEEREPRCLSFRSREICFNSLLMLNSLYQGGSSLGYDGLCGWRTDCASWTQGRWRLRWQAKESTMNSLWTLCVSLCILWTATNRLFRQCSKKSPRALCHGQSTLRQRSLPSSLG